MAKLTAFQEFFSEPQNFDGRYVINAERLWSEESIVNRFLEYFKDWHWITDDRYLRHQIRDTNRIAWVKWHAGINDDGEPQNMWWLYDTFPVGKKGYKAVYVFKWDKHYIEFGHKFQPPISSEGRALWSHPCDTCGRL